MSSHFLSIGNGPDPYSGDPNALPPANGGADSDSNRRRITVFKSGGMDETDSDLISSSVQEQPKHKKRKSNNSVPLSSRLREMKRQGRKRKMVSTAESAEEGLKRKNAELEAELKRLREQGSKKPLQINTKTVNTTVNNSSANNQDDQARSAIGEIVGKVKEDEKRHVQYVEEAIKLSNHQNEQLAQRMEDQINQARKLAHNDSFVINQKVATNAAHQRDMSKEVNEKLAGLQQLTEKLVNAVVEIKSNQNTPKFIQEQSQSGEATLNSSSIASSTGRVGIQQGNNTNRFTIHSDGEVGQRARAKKDLNTSSFFEEEDESAMPLDRENDSGNEGDGSGSESSDSGESLDPWASNGYMIRKRSDREGQAIGGTSSALSFQEDKYKIGLSTKQKKTIRAGFLKERTAPGIIVQVNRTSDDPDPIDKARLLWMRQQQNKRLVVTRPTRERRLKYQRESRLAGERKDCDREVKKILGFIEGGKSKDERKAEKSGLVHKLESHPKSLDNAGNMGKFLRCFRVWIRAQRKKDNSRETAAFSQEDEFCIISHLFDGNRVLTNEQKKNIKREQACDLDDPDHASIREFLRCLRTLKEETTGVIERDTARAIYKKCVKREEGEKFHLWSRRISLLAKKAEVNLSYDSDHCQEAEEYARIEAAARFDDEDARRIRAAQQTTAVPKTADTVLSFALLKQQDEKEFDSKKISTIVEEASRAGIVDSNLQRTLVSEAVRADLGVGDVGKLVSETKKMIRTTSKVDQVTGAVASAAGLHPAIPDNKFTTWTGHFNEPVQKEYQPQGGYENETGNETGSECDPADEYQPQELVYEAYVNELLNAHKKTHKVSTKKIGKDACFICGETGHWARECKKVNEGPLCFGCGKPGHKVIDCKEGASFREAHFNILQERGKALVRGWSKKGKGKGKKGKKGKGKGKKGGKGFSSKKGLEKKLHWNAGTRQSKGQGGKGFNRQFSAHFNNFGTENAADDDRKQNQNEKEGAATPGEKSGENLNLNQEMQKNISNQKKTDDKRKTELFDGLDLQSGPSFNTNFNKVNGSTNNSNENESYGLERIRNLHQAAGISAEKAFSQKKDDLRAAEERAASGSLNQQLQSSFGKVSEI